MNGPVNKTVSDQNNTIKNLFDSFASSVNYLFQLNIEEIRKIECDTKTTALELFVIGKMKKALVDGNIKSFDFLISFLPKESMDNQVTESENQYDYTKLSTEEVLELKKIQRKMTNKT